LAMTPFSEPTESASIVPPKCGGKRTANRIELTPLPTPRRAT
jgi:hypothetical protein